MWRSSPWPRTVGLYALGHALLAVPVVVTFVRGDNPPEVLFTLFTPGLVAWLLGLVLMAVGAFKARRIPRAVAIALPATLPLTLALGDPGVLVEVVTWAVLAAFLLGQMRARSIPDDEAVLPCDGGSQEAAQSVSPSWDRS
ncbi:hypothetical protein ACQEVF_23560 [Nonomuraea polychroma]|uniref:hypothetical protein n=1 Tax=Nonomuraea polychroma TaxID=46176 RepID=UPI003D943CE0